MFSRIYGDVNNADGRRRVKNAEVDQDEWLGAAAGSARS
jgi:hypothetical protein